MKKQYITLISLILLIALTILCSAFLTKSGDDNSSHLTESIDSSDFLTNIDSSEVETATSVTTSAVTAKENPVVTTSCTTATTPTKKEQQSNNDEYKTYVNQVFTLVNEIRNKYKLPSIKYSAELNAIAEKRAEDNYRSSIDNSYQVPKLGVLLNNKGIEYYYLAENNAANYENPTNFVYNLMQKSDSKAILLNPRLNTMGVGIYKSNKNSLYINQIFIG